MTAPLESLKGVLLAHWNAFEGLSCNAAGVKALDGHNLDLATVVAVARYVATRSSMNSVAKFCSGTTAVLVYPKMHIALLPQAP